MRNLADLQKKFGVSYVPFPIAWEWSKLDESFYTMCAIYKIQVCFLERLSSKIIRAAALASRGYPHLIIVTFDDQLHTTHKVYGKGAKQVASTSFTITPLKHVLPEISKRKKQPIEDNRW